MTQQTDAIIIGGGVVGCAVAYYLAKNNIKPTIIERGDIASATSCRCDGNVMASDCSPGADAILAKTSIEMIPSVINELDYDVHWNHRGSLIVFENDEEMEAGKEHVRRLNEDGISTRILDKKQVHEDEPNLADDIVGGMETDCDAMLDPISFTIGLSRGAEKLGAILQKYTRVLDIKKKKNNDFNVTTDKGDFCSPIVINAAGAWAGKIGDMVGLNIPIRPRQGHILVAEQTVQVARRKVMEFGYLMSKYSNNHKRHNVTKDMAKYGVALVYELTHANNFLLGSSRQFVGFDIRCNERIIKAIAQRAMRFFPVIKDVNIIRSYAGVRPFCEDHVPIISDTSIDGFYIASGHEGNGIGLALITGKLISQFICAQPKMIDVEPLSFKRFEETNCKTTAKAR